ncbi:hypothetical protein LINPERHAP1_LOCUS34071 [Linum perenne]
MPRTLALMAVQRQTAASRSASPLIKLQQGCADVLPMLMLSKLLSTLPHTPNLSVSMGQFPFEEPGVGFGLGVVGVGVGLVGVGVGVGVGFVGVGVGFGVVGVGVGLGVGVGFVGVGVGFGFGFGVGQPPPQCAETMETKRRLSVRKRAKVEFVWEAISLYGKWNC